ncbi:AAA family ATPase [Anaerolineales bacterium HSG25]|nr:AAA family ATPase [Anaerolineales bacterium HSG25]
MQKRFNDTGVCIPKRHYMVDTTSKLEQVIQLVDWGEYFTINRPRQFGKTTTLFLLDKALNRLDAYLSLRISFEGIDDQTHQNDKAFINEFLILLAQRLSFLGWPDLSDTIEQTRLTVTTLPELSRFISKLVQLSPEKQWVLMIDEVDKSSNNQLFLDFLGLLRNKYLNRDDGEATFQSVILAGVHDIKTLKQKIRPDGSGGYNSPWNIAVDFKVDLSFSAPEIETMLTQYGQEKAAEINIASVAERLYYYSSGYPYLVSKLCKFIDEDILPPRADKNWSLADVETAFAMIVGQAYTTTLFDSLTKNLENNEELYDLVFQIVINGERITFTIANPIINLAHLYGIIVPSSRGHCQIHNRIFEQRIYDYMLSKFIQKKHSEVNRFGGPNFYTANGLDMPLILQRFQAFMKEHYSDRDTRFIEREGRLLFLAYLRSIINGIGFDFKEPNVSHERRMDLVITYQNKRYVVELKIWRGQQYHEEGLDQLSDYLDSYSLKEGYLLIYDFNKSKTYREEQIQHQDKSIFAVWV